MTQIAALPMYDCFLANESSDAIWRFIEKDIVGEDAELSELDRTSSCHSLWTAGNKLKLTQSCGYPLVREYSDYLTVVGTPIYAAVGCEGTSYRSAIIAHSTCSASSIMDIVLLGESLSLVTNSFGSFSGWLMLTSALSEGYSKVRQMEQNSMLPTGGGRTTTSRLSKVLITGSHIGSIKAIQQRKGDIAAIDCVSLALARSNCPDLLRGVKIIGWSQSAPALPFVTNLDASLAKVASLRRGLQNMLSNTTDLSVVLARRQHLLVGVDVTGSIDLSAYQKAVHKHIQLTQSNSETKYLFDALTITGKLPRHNFVVSSDDHTGDTSRNESYPHQTQQYSHTHAESPNISNSVTIDLQSRLEDANWPEADFLTLHRLKVFLAEYLLDTIHTAVEHELEKTNPDNSTSGKKVRADGAGNENEEYLTLSDIDKILTPKLLLQALSGIVGKQLWPVMPDGGKPKLMFCTLEGTLRLLIGTCIADPSHGSSSSSSSSSSNNNYHHDATGNTGSTSGIDGRSKEDENISADCKDRSEGGGDALPASAASSLACNRSVHPSWRTIHRVAHDALVLLLTQMNDTSSSSSSSSSSSPSASSPSLSISGEDRVITSPYFAGFMGGASDTLFECFDDESEAANRTHNQNENENENENENRNRTVAANNAHGSEQPNEEKKQEIAGIQSKLHTADNNNNNNNNNEKSSSSGSSDQEEEDDANTKELLDKLWAADIALSHHLLRVSAALGIWVYISAPRHNERHDWANLVIAENEQSIINWRDSRAHSAVRTQIAPWSYEHIRLHRGVLTGGLLGESMQLVRTTFLGPSDKPRTVSHANESTLSAEEARLPTCPFAAGYMDLETAQHPPPDEYERKVLHLRLNSGNNGNPTGSGNGANGGGEGGRSSGKSNNARCSEEKREMDPSICSSSNLPPPPPPPPPSSSSSSSSLHRPVGSTIKGFERHVVYWRDLKNPLSSLSPPPPPPPHTHASADTSIDPTTTSAAPAVEAVSSTVATGCIHSSSWNTVPPGGGGVTLGEFYALLTSPTSSPHVEVALY